MARRGFTLIWVWRVALVLALLILGAFQWLNAPLQTAAAPQGIISFELAGSAARSQAMLDSWTGRDRLYAAFSLGLDYLFLVSYAVAIGGAAWWVGDRFGARRHWLRPAGRGVAWGIGWAALLDAVENLALLLMLLAGTVPAPLSALAAGCAGVKFVLVTFGSAFALVGLVVHGLTRLRAALGSG